MNGIVIIDKPAGWTSMDVCAKLRGILHERRIGHSGTLDPMATGVLAVFVGRATRAVEFCEADDKEYLAAMRLGTVTDTQDITGTVLETHPVSVSDAALNAALLDFTGDISQIPPMYSAVKIGGKKMYELARKGQSVERAARPVTIKALELLSREGDEVSLRVVCSKGTYIRTLCHDIGAALGCGACLTSLRRTRSGHFTLDQARSLEQAAELGEAALSPTDAVFSQYPALTLNAAGEKRCRCGSEISLPGTEDGLYRVYGENQTFLMLGEAKSGVLRTIKSFFEVN